MTGHRLFDRFVNYLWPFISLSLFMFTSTAESAETSMTKISDVTFDSAQTLKNSPLLSENFRASWIRFGAGPDAYRFENNLDIHTIFRINLDFTRTYHNDAGSRLFNTLGSFRAGVHVPLEKLSIAWSGTWTWHRGIENNSGPGTYLLIEFSPTEYAMFDFATESFLADRRLNNDVDLGFSARNRYFHIRLGFRFLSIDKKTISGQSISLGAHF